MVVMAVVYLAVDWVLAWTGVEACAGASEVGVAEATVAVAVVNEKEVDAAMVVAVGVAGEEEAMVVAALEVAQMVRARVEAVEAAVAKEVVLRRVELLC